MRIGIVAGVACLALAGCSSPEDMEDDIGVEGRVATPEPPAKDSDSAETDREEKAKAVAVDFSDNEKDGNAEREFSYAWPAAASAEPQLAKILTERRDKALAEQKREWNEAVAEFGTDDCVTCVSRDHSTQWEVVADTPRFLSLSSGTYVYMGGAHGNSGFGGLVWDRKAGASLDARQMFESAGALWAAAESAYCTALDAEREKRRGRPVRSDDFGSDCPGLDDLTLLVGSSNGKTFNRLGIQAAPYVAGAYAEGPYEVTLPVTRSILGAVKSEYRPFFSTGG